MSDVEIVIKIPENLYNNLKNGCGIYPYRLIYEAIANGIPLPKGHGDLIDRNELLKHYDSTTYHNGIEERKIHFVQIGYVNDAPTIIEADKEDVNYERDR